MKDLFIVQCESSTILLSRLIKTRSEKVSRLQDSARQSDVQKSTNLSRDLTYLEGPKPYLNNLLPVCFEIINCFLAIIRDSYVKRRAKKSVTLSAAAK